MVLRVEIVRELDDTLSQLAADLELSKEATATLLLSSALVMEASRD